jgi:hypothetical protein
MSLTRVGDCRRVQALDHLCRRECGEDFEDQRLQFGAVLVALGVAGKARIGGHLGAQQHGVAEGLPFALVLQAQHHRGAIAGRKRPVRVDAGVAGAGARRRRCAVKGVVHRVAHPLAHGFEHGHVDVAARARPARSSRADRMLL